MQSQSDNYKKQDFAFLANPPPPRHKSQLPASTQLAFSAILSWAATVQPGSPAPVSPQRRPSVSSTSGSPRRPSVADEIDLTALGYTTVFVHLPKTPTTPSPYLREYNLRHNRVDVPMPPMEPAPPKRKGMRRFRSLSILRPRGAASKQKPAAQESVSPAKTTFSAKPAKPKPKAAQKRAEHDQQGQAASPDLAPAEICAASIAQRKRARYAHVRPPPPLATELAMMQFTDGHALETHVRTVMERQARAAAGSGGNANTGVGDVYRDGKGGIWWDADEEMEYAHLLGGRTVQEAMKEGAEALEGEWEAFDEDQGHEPLAAFLAHQPTSPSEVAPAAADTRRTSLSSVSSLDSDLDPQYLLPLPELEDTRQTPTDDRVLASRRIGGPALGAMLALPARPGRTAGHLRKARSAFIGEEAMVGGKFSTPSSALDVEMTQAGARPRPKGIARRRPAPLTLASSNTARAVVVVRRSGSVQSQRGAIVGNASTAAPMPAVDTSANAASSTASRAARAAPPAPAPEPAIALPRIPSDSLRREFIEASFAPPPASAPPASTSTASLHPYAAPAASLVPPLPASRTGTPMQPGRSTDTLIPTPAPTPTRGVLLGASDPQEQYAAYARAGTPASQLAGGTPRTPARFGVRALFGLRKRVD